MRSYGVFLKRYPRFKNYYKECKYEFKRFYSGDYDLEYEKAIKELRSRCKDHYFYLQSVLLPKTITGLLTYRYEDSISDIALDDMKQSNSLINLIKKDKNFVGGTFKIPEFESKKK